MSEIVEQLKLGDWLAELRRVAGMDAGAFAIDTPTTQALLDLTRVAAHRSDRIAAPISAYLLGLAAAEMRETERAAWIRSLVLALEAEAQAGQ